MLIKVMSQQSAEDKIFNEGDYVISITDPEAPLANLKIPEKFILRLSFYDVDKPIKDLSGRIWNPMATKDAKKIAKFIFDNVDKIQVLNVHCRAGISRSAGVSAGVSQYFTGQSDYYFQHYIPNMWCYSLVIRALSTLEKNNKNSNVILM